VAVFIAIFQKLKNNLYDTVFRYFNRLWAIDIIIKSYLIEKFQKTYKKSNFSHGIRFRAQIQLRSGGLLVFD